MKLKYIITNLGLLFRTAVFGLLSLVMAAQASAFDSFVVKDIRVLGLQRIDLGTTLNYLPIVSGETLNEQQSAAIIRSLFKTGFFDDVRLAVDQDVLVVTVIERPAIAALKITGNEDIKTEQLLKALDGIGLSKGRVFDRSALDKVERELERQYNSQGKYSVKIKSTVAPLDNNRVDLIIEIDEGAVARIRHINVVGNNVFAEEELLSLMKLTSDPSWFSDDDQYSSQLLAADIEALRSHYLDHGYVNFGIDSTQVSITPDKQAVFITINISEGQQFFIDKVALGGERVVAEEKLDGLVSIKAGDVFSRKQIAMTTTAISAELGEAGYAFANVNAIPEIDKEKRRISLTFFMDPGKRVYVRRLNISGNLKSYDEVVRREFRQLEGGWLSTANINRSRIRLQQLGFFEDVNIETPAVPGTDDQVDINVTVTERPSGTLMAGIGYGQAQGFLVNASVSQNNFLGTGSKLSANINNSAVSDVYSFSFTNPYYTKEGVSRGFRVSYSKTDAGQANVANYTTDVYGGSVTYGIPLNEYDRASLTLGYENTQVNTSDLTPSSFKDYLIENSDHFDIFNLSLSWTRDTRNRAIFADSGGIVNITSQVTLPGSGLQFYKIGARSQRYFPLVKDFIFMLKGDFGYGDSYGDTSALPFYERYYTGGAQSVRGYRGNSLGPRIDDNPEGGALKLVANAELIFPVPFAESGKNFRMSAFIDGGNVFAAPDGVNISDLKDFPGVTEKLRYSTGFTAIWMTPVAPLTFSYAWALNDKPGDETEQFQFTLGAFFF
jgi:outer membrane protein insertion porin family